MAVMKVGTHDLVNTKPSVSVTIFSSDPQLGKYMILIYEKFEHLL